MNKQQLANKIWASANKMRSKIEANEYKDYILGLIFYKFLSDNEVNYLKANGWEDEDLETLKEDYNDEESKINLKFCQDNIGYFIEYKYLFSTWLQPNSSFDVSSLSDALKSFERLVSPNYAAVYKGIFKTLETGLSKLGENTAAQTKALKALIKLIKDIPTDGSQDYDVLGYVYEFLIGNFASHAGKKAGEFYTPHEVAQLMSEIVAEHHKDKRKISIYDPTSGSGSLLITIGRSIGRHIEDKHRVKYHAQELKENTYNLTRMNLIMRGIRPDNIVTRCADSLDEDWPIITAGSDIGKPLRVDAVVSNPPYSQHWDPTGWESDNRFKEYGGAPKSKADYAFLLHELHHLESDGIMTIVLPHGVLFRGDPEDKSEGQIRSKLIEKNNIDAIIGLPANIFFGTGIPTLVMVLKQKRSQDDVLIIDASKGFVKDGKQNKLRACDIKRIVDVYKQRKSVPGFSAVVSREQIRENNYNLNIPRYVDSSEKPVNYDIYATMYGGIPQYEIEQLKDYWMALPSLKDELFETKDNTPYASLKTTDISETIKENNDVKRLQSDFATAMDGFDTLLQKLLIADLTSVKDLRTQDWIAEDIFRRLNPIPLVDHYTAYQALAERWPAIYNDIEMIQTEGLETVRVVEPAYKIVKKDDEEIEVPDGIKGRIIPFELVQGEKFKKELNEIDELTSKVENIVAQLDETLEEFKGNEDWSDYLDDDNEKFDKSKIKKDAKAKGDEIEPETKAKLKELVTLWDDQSKTNKEIKKKKLELIDKTKEAIENLSDEEIETFLYLKWIMPVCKDINSTLATVTESLQKEVSSLAEKYAVSFTQLNEELSNAQNELSDIIAQLTGDEYAIKGLEGLSEYLKA